MVHTTTLDLPTGLLFLGRKEMSLQSMMRQGTISSMRSYLLVVSSRQRKQGEPVYGQKSTLSDTEKVPPITRGAFSCRQSALTAASNLSPQSMQLYTKVALFANYTTLSQWTSALPWKDSICVFPAQWNGAFLVAASTLDLPISAREKRSWRLRLCSSTTSQSRRNSFPTPKRSKFTATTDPRPPTPRISTACLSTFFWSQSSILTCRSKGPPKKQLSNPYRSRINLTEQQQQQEQTIISSLNLAQVRLWLSDRCSVVIRSQSLYDLVLLELVFF